MQQVHPEIALDRQRRKLLREGKMGLYWFLYATQLASALAGAALIGYMIWALEAATRHIP